MFAACHNQFKIVRLLMQYSRQRQHPGSELMQEWHDANGNNVLHMMAISGLKVRVSAYKTIHANVELQPFRSAKYKLQLSVVGDNSKL